MLIPFFFLIGTYGRGDRVRATIKMMVYTLVGSLLMLVGAIATAVLASDQIGHLTFSIAELRANLLPSGSQEWIFLFFAAAFLVKMPAVPLHGWMPDAYRSAPLPVLALLSGVLPKVAAYGFLRVVLPIFPEATVHFQELILVFALASVLYGSVDGLHPDQRPADRRLFVDRPARLHHARDLLPALRRRRRRRPADVQPRRRRRRRVLHHRLARRALRHRGPARDGRMAAKAPYLAALFMIVTLATLAMPGSANFIGEFYILNGLFQAKIAFAVVAISGVAMAAFYALRLYQRSMHNRLPRGQGLARDRLARRACC